jgi:hypothetical protein
MFDLSLFPGTTLAARAHSVAAVNEATLAVVEPEVPMNRTTICDAIFDVAARLAHAR